MSAMEELKSQDIPQTAELSQPAQHNPIVLCGPSGVGKGTLSSLLFQDWGDIMAKKISHTTRPPRPGEINGVHYHFVTVEEFERGIAEGKFIEYAKVHTNYYGTTFESVHSARSKGHIVLLELDIQGVRTVREKTRVTPDQGLECTYIFIWPPNEEELYVRLRGRGSDSEEIIKTRLQTAREELDAAKNEPHLFDFTLVNEDLDRCYIELNQIIAKLFPHLADRAKTVCERIAAKKSQEANGANATSPNSK